MVGTGYVGLVSGACFADFGHEVVCVDVDAAKIARLERGEIPIFEPGLDALVARNRRAGRLRFATDLAGPLQTADAVFIAVGTPTVEGAGRRGAGHADLQYVFKAAESIAGVLKGQGERQSEPGGDRFTVVVTKSTVPVGTGDEIDAILRGRLAPSRFAVVSNPEFLREGAAIEDFKRPDRVVVGLPGGAQAVRARAVMEAVYGPLNLNKTPLLFTGRRTSELIKYAANAFLATKITFINEMADLCEAVGANVQEVARGIGLDGRIGSKFLHAGPGYGGSCFPKDTLALVKTAQDHQVELSIVESVVAANTARKRRMADKVAQAVGGVDGGIEGKTIGVLGLAFKPNTDDMREAPALSILPRLQAAGATVRAYDPEAMEAARPLLPGVTLCASARDVGQGADALVVLTEWDEFRGLPLAEFASAMRGDVLVDLRNVFSRREAARAGLRYEGVGRPAGADGGAADRGEGG